MRHKTLRHKTFILFYIPLFTLKGSLIDMRICGSCLLPLRETSSKRLIPVASRGPN